MLSPYASPCDSTSIQTISSNRKHSTSTAWGWRTTETQPRTARNIGRVNRSK